MFFHYGGLYVTFTCNPGFRIHGYRTSSCVSGRWARNPPLCVGYHTKSCFVPLHQDASALVISCMEVLWFLKTDLWPSSAVTLDSVCLVLRFSSARGKAGTALSARIINAYILYPHDLDAVNVNISADVDECEQVGSALCVFGCINMPGRFQCLCPVGYQLDSTNTHGVDLNECDEMVVFQQKLLH
ncbi:hypothetical protein cypCar_00035099, partial [Cyprinus carpio]